MTKREFLDIVFALAPTEANAIMDAFDEYVDINEPHWIPVTEDTPTEDGDYWATFDAETGRFVDWASWYQGRWVTWIDGSPAPLSNVIAWCKPLEPYKGATDGND